MMIVLLALCVNSCFGIKCFFCESNSNKDCENNLAYVKIEVCLIYQFFFFFVINFKLIKLQNCTAARITSMGGEWLSNGIQKVSEAFQVNLPPMGCSKAVFTTGQFFL